MKPPGKTVSSDVPSWVWKISALLLCGGFTGCAALTNPVARGVPASEVPVELLGESREGEQMIPMNLLRQPTGDAYRLGPGDVLGVYIEGILGDEKTPLPLVRAPEKTRRAPEREEMASSLGYPIHVRQDNTISLPHLKPLPVGRKTLDEAEQAIRKAYVEAKILQPGKERTFVTLQHKRLYQVLVFRRDLAGRFADILPVTRVGLFGSGAELFGKGITGQGYEITLPAYENDVLHALALTGGFPGTNAARCITIYREGNRKVAPGQSPPVKKAATLRPALEKVGYQRFPGYPYGGGIGNVHHRAADPLLEQKPVRSAVDKIGFRYLPGNLYGPNWSGQPRAGDPQRVPDQQPLRPAVDKVGIRPPPNYPYIGPNWSGQPPAADPQLVPEQKPLGPPVDKSGFRSNYPYVGPIWNGQPRDADPPLLQQPKQFPAREPVWNGKARGAEPETLPEPNALPRAGQAADCEILPEPKVFPGEGQVVHIPLRFRPGEPLPFGPDDIVLHTGDIVFVDAGPVDTFFTAGLLPPAEHVLPRDYDLDVVQAVARVRGPLVNGAFGGSNLSGVLIQPGVGNPSPRLLTVIRRLPHGGTIPIVIDLHKALVDPRERILVQPGDVLILQETPMQALVRYFTDTFNFTAIFRVFPSRDTLGINTISIP